MITLLSDPAVRALPVRDCGDPLVALDGRPGAPRVRRGLAERLAQAQTLLPDGLLLKVVEGYRSPQDQLSIIDRYSREVRAAASGLDTGWSEDTGLAEEMIGHLTSRFVAPLDVAPHVAGAAVDLTLVDVAGDELDLGTAIDETPEQSGGRCYFDAPDISPDARAHRELLARVLGAAGLVNYPTEWWHWSYGDRYWALCTGRAEAIYGPIDASADAA